VASPARNGKKSTKHLVCWRKKEMEMRRTELFFFQKQKQFVYGAILVSNKEENFFHHCLLPFVNVLNHGRQGKTVDGRRIQAEQITFSELCLQLQLQLETKKKKKN
jgi:hypothetical protein